MAEIPSSAKGEVHVLRAMLDQSSVVSVCLQKCRRGGKPEHMCAAGRCRRQPWGLHGLSVHGGDTSAACWGSAQTREEDFFRHADWRVLSQGRFNRRGLV